MGTLQIVSFYGGLLCIKTFALFKNRLIHVDSFYLNRNGVTFKLLSNISVELAQGFAAKRAKNYSEVNLPASIVFETIAFAPLDPVDNWDISK